MPNNGDFWPEQEAIENWFSKHSMELKDAVTKERLAIQTKLTTAKDEVKELEADALKDKYRRRAMLEVVSGLEKEVKALREVILRALFLEGENHGLGVMKHEIETDRWIEDATQALASSSGEGE